MFDRFTNVQTELQAFFPILPEYFCSLKDMNGRANLSSNWESLLGWNQELLESTPWIEWMDSSSILLWRDRLTSLCDRPKPGKIATVETRLRHQDDRWQQVSWRICLGKDDWFYAVAQPIHEIEPASINFIKDHSTFKSLTLFDLRDRNIEPNRWRSLVEHSTSAIWIQDIHANILYISASVEEILGYPAQELLGKQSWDLIHPEDINRAQATFEQLLNTPEQTVAIDYRIRHQDGSWRVFHSIAKNLLNHPSIEGILTNSYEMASAKPAEHRWQTLNEELKQKLKVKTAQLQKTNQQLQAEILDRQHAELEFKKTQSQWRQIIDKLSDGVLILNREGIVLFSNSYADLLFNMKHEDLIDMHFGIPNSKNEICEIYLPQANGSYITVEMRIETIEWQGNPAYIASLRDIRDRQQAQFRLRESEERYRTLAESAQDLIFILNCDRSLAYINSFGAKLLGIEDQIKPDLDQLEPISIVEKFNNLESSLEQVFILNRSIRIEDRLFYENSELWLDTFLVPLRDEFGQISSIFGLARDITQLKSIEQSLRKTQGQLRQREKLLRLTLEQAPIGIVTCDLSGKFLHFNPAFCQILGYSARNLRQMSWVDITDRDDWQNQDRYAQKLLQGQLRSFQLENCYQRQDGTKIQGIIRVALIRDSQGNPLHYVAQLEDVTDRKQAEAKIQASLKEKEVLIKEIHHRVKNNLQIVSSLLDLQAAYIEDPKVLEKLDDSKHRLLAMSLIHETLYQSETLARVDLRDYIERLATNILFAQTTDYHRIHLQFDLESIFLNLETAIPCGLLLNELITNCIKHAFPEPRKGKISIALHHQAPTDTLEQNPTDCQTEPIRLRVSDNGVGLPKHINFQPTKSLGLRLIQDLTQQLRGTLNVIRENGTEFQLTFSELKYRDRI